MTTNRRPGFEPKVGIYPDVHQPNRSCYLQAFYIFNNFILLPIECLVMDCEPMPLKAGVNYWFREVFHIGKVPDYEGFRVNNA